MTPELDASPGDGALHLLSVWNPSYADDAMDRHLEVLLDWAERRDRGEADEEDVYVWWGKLRSPCREGALPHRDEVLALEEQIEAGVDTHLYLTDHRSLYVARLVEVTDAPVLEETPGELDHMPGYYQDHEVDFWFRVWDLRRLVHSSGYKGGGIRSLNLGRRPCSFRKSNRKDRSRPLARLWLSGESSTR